MLTEAKQLNIGKLLNNRETQSLALFPACKMLFCDWTSKYMPDKDVEVIYSILLSLYIIYSLDESFLCINVFSDYYVIMLVTDNWTEKLKIN